MDKPIDLLLIDARVKDGRGHVVLADQAHDPTTAHHIILDFPVEAQPDAPFEEREARIVRDAEGVLAAARAALKER